MIARLLILLAIAIVGWVLFKKLTSPPKGSDRRSGGDYEHMVRCERCGVHVPDTAAIRRGERAYCCREHAEQSRQ